ncbi:MAG: hypothetical protein H7224_06500 [Polaromonas sp.]|nr:hypothetical protein [Polaromonas sp.]
MNDREILTATLRWYTAHEARMKATTISNRFKSERKKRTGFGGADFELSASVTAAKRVELAALRELAKVCAKVRGHQRDVDDAYQVVEQTLLSQRLKCELPAGLQV